MPLSFSFQFVVIYFLSKYQSLYFQLLWLILQLNLDHTFGSNIKLNHKHDPSLIGGLIIKVGSTMIDTSLKSKIQKIEKKMIEA